MSIQRQVLEHRILKQVNGDTIKNYAMYRVYLKLFFVFVQRHVLQDIILKQVYGDTIKHCVMYRVAACVYLR